jgi:transposase
MHQQKICEWIECFKEGRTSVTDESRPGRPSTLRTDQHIQRVDALIREDQRLTLARVAQVRLAWWRPASGEDVAL